MKKIVENMGNLTSKNGQIMGHNGKFSELLETVLGRVFGIPESFRVKTGRDVVVLQRRHVAVSGIIHIGKESNNLGESEVIGVGSMGYEVYENLEDLDEKFRKISDRILELKPRDVKKVGISKQTLCNAKLRIITKELERITTRTKFSLLLCIVTKVS